MRRGNVVWCINVIYGVEGDFIGLFGVIGGDLEIDVFIVVDEDGIYDIESEDGIIELRDSSIKVDKDIGVEEGRG